MATFKVIAGDFGEGKTGQILVGPLYRQSGQGFNMPVHGHTFKTEHIGTGQIETLEIATEENLKKIGGAIGWGVVGGLALGPIGALAGVLAGGRKKEITFVCRFKDGRKFIGSCSTKTFTDIQAACFTAPVASTPPQETPTHVKIGRALLAVGLSLIAFLFIAFLTMDKSNKGSNLPNAGLNQPAVELASYLIVDDIQAVLLKDQNAITATPIEDLLGWAKLDWRTTAKNYDSAYEANEIAADRDFKGKKILLSGTIDSIEKDFTDSSFITLRSSGLMGVHAQLSKQSAEKAASFTKGQHLYLVCDGGGRVVSVATLDNCELFSDYLNEVAPSVESRVTEFLSGERTLRSAVAVPVTTMYVTGLSMPANSPCINGRREVCRAEVASIFKHKTTLQTIQSRANEMMATLKVN
jgi:hypothetical protein